MVLNKSGVVQKTSKANNGHNSYKSLDRAMYSKKIDKRYVHLSVDRVNDGE